MKVYKLVQRFDSKTGNPTTPIREITGWLCDYCGKFTGYDNDDDDNRETTYEVNEIGGCEPTFDGLEIKGHKKISPYIIFGGDHSYFEYCQNFMSGETSCEILMIRDKDETTNYDSIAEIFYHARLNMLKKALEKFTLEQLGLDEDY